jgi:hypothetical protein
VNHHPAQPSIDDLRAAFASATPESERLAAFAALVFHDDARWSDLLAGLDDSPQVAQTAALYLHTQLHTPHRGSPILEKTTWLTILADSGHSPDDKVTPPPPAPPLEQPAQPSLWQRIHRILFRRPR